jgi:hypothetical protein
MGRTAVRRHAVKWTRLSCTAFLANAIRLQLQALAYNLTNFLLIRFGFVFYKARRSRAQSM